MFSNRDDEGKRILSIGRLPIRDSLALILCILLLAASAALTREIGELSSLTDRNNELYMIWLHLEAISYGALLFDRENADLQFTEMKAEFHELRTGYAALAQDDLLNRSSDDVGDLLPISLDDYETRIDELFDTAPSEAYDEEAKRAFLASSLSLHKAIEASWESTHSSTVEIGRIYILLRKWD